MRTQDGMYVVVVVGQGLDSYPDGEDTLNGQFKMKV
jgi:hypothetical protein